MASMRTRLGTAVLSCLAVGAAFGPGVSYADGVATTGGVTSVTSNSAVFQGVANTASSDSEWFFQYGTAAGALNSTTAPQALNQPGVTAVSKAVSPLSSNTTYFYRLVVVDQSYSGTPHYGDTLNFTTSGSTSSTHPGGGPSKPRYGVASLSFRTLAVRHGRLTIPIRCAGARGTLCKGTVAVSTKTKHHRAVACAGGRFSAAAGHTAKVGSSVSRGCRSLLAAAGRHRLAATLKATFTTHQRTVKKSVTLIG